MYRTSEKLPGPEIDMAFDPPPLSISIADVDPALWAGGVRGALAGARAAGFRAVTLNGAMAEIRPRDLDRSARRDLAALLRRSELACSGIDLWIPSEHFVDPARVDRAIGATLEAIELAADLARLAGSGIVSPGQTGAGKTGRILSVVLPPTLAPAAHAAIADQAERCSVRVADCQWPVRDSSAAPAGQRDGAPDHNPIGVGLDPAKILLADGNPVAQASTLAASRRLVSARLSDAGPGGRVPPGARQGRLDLVGYAVALVTGGYQEHIVLDLRSVPDQAAAMHTAQTLWAQVFSALIE
jgi:sugar phosphate isomerase/epimerase